MQARYRRTLHHLVLPLLLAALVFPVAAMAEETPRRTLTITGVGEVRGAPGRATISTGVVSEARTAAKALAANTKAMTAAIARIKALGIADRDLQTSSFSVFPRYYSEPKSRKPARIVGYTVSNQLTVIIRDLSELGRVLDAVVSQGANQISGPTFGFDDPEKLRDIARARAAADASRKAKLYAEALGVTLGPIVSISEAGNFSPRPTPMAARMEMDRSRPVPIEAGELGLNARVNVVWEIQ
ncbi:hypothetical protein MNBD_ALPHA09-2257 [hydrothermal vent metagenome]|uniref:Outer membrane protein assembly factor YaeT n=1 Tax=hydrothermal vent metagenome TaxID=652676 RepID=A0A3B0TAH8_9ZZZZ